MKFNIKQKGQKSPRDESLIKLLCSPAIIAWGISTPILPENTNELCDRLKLLIQEKQGGKIPDMLNAEILSLIDKLLGYKLISTKQHQIFLL